jgi:hypothetical protein
VPFSQVALAPQGVSVSRGTHVPGTPGVPWQVKHSLHGGVQSQDPQSTGFLQLLMTDPHFPAQVWATDSGRHFFFSLPDFRAPGLLWR